MQNNEGNTIVLEAWMNRRLPFLQFFLKLVDASLIDHDLTNKAGISFAAVKGQFDIEMMKLEMERLNEEHHQIQMMKQQ